MDYIKGRERTQITMLPDCVDDLVGQDNPVRVIDAFITNMSLEEAGIKRAKGQSAGKNQLQP